jgi:hypothetical protein
MAETCIVCLGDLAPPDEPASAADVPVAIDPLALALAHGANDDQATRVAAEPTKEDETVAHLLPCGHNLHNECLKPWVERANSCPICRASFNLVEISARVGGM